LVRFFLGATIERVLKKKTVVILIYHFGKIVFSYKHLHFSLYFLPLCVFFAFIAVIFYCKGCKGHGNVRKENFS